MQVLKVPDFLFPAVILHSYARFNADDLRIEAHLTAALLVSESSSQVISGSVFLSGRQVLRSYWCHLSLRLLTAETAPPG